jgi:hypothetical protein
MRLNIHLHLSPRLRMIGDIPPLPIYAFMACMGTTLPFNLCLTFTQSREMGTTSSGIPEKYRQSFNNLHVFKRTVLEIRQNSNAVILSGHNSLEPQLCIFHLRF